MQLTLKTDSFAHVARIQMIETIHSNYLIDLWYLPQIIRQNIRISSCLQGRIDLHASREGKIINDLWGGKNWKYKFTDRSIIKKWQLFIIQARIHRQLIFISPGITATHIHRNIIIIWVHINICITDVIYPRLFVRLHQLLLTIINFLSLYTMYICTHSNLIHS